MSEPVAWRVIVENKWWLFDKIEDAFKYCHYEEEPEPLYVAGEQVSAMSIPDRIGLREFFAGCALSHEYTEARNLDLIANQAYDIADAMLEKKKATKDGTQS